MGVASIDAPVARTASAAARVLPFMQRRASGEPLRANGSRLPTGCVGISTYNTIKLDYGR
jgi:hypothetical protein